MQVQTLPAAAGWRWLGAGFAIFRRNPPLLAMLIVCYWLTVLFLNIVPVLAISNAGSRSACQPCSAASRPTPAR